MNEPPAPDPKPPLEPDQPPPKREDGFASRPRAWLFGAPGTFDGAPVTRAVVWANMIVFVAMVAFSHSGDAILTMPIRTMIAFGANIAPSTLYDGRVETLLTSCFLHFGLMHIAFNMIALRQIGPLVERSVGSLRFAPMYLVAGIAGSIGSALLWRVHHAPMEVRYSAGASGAICGVIGAAMILGTRAQGWKGPLAQSMARWLGTVFLFGWIGHFDNAAHAGGALAGAAVAALWRRGRVHSNASTKVMIGASAALCLVAAITVAVRDAMDPFASLDVEARYARTVDALSAGRCDEARHGAAATQRLAPTEPQVERLAREVAQRCANARGAGEGL